MNKLKVITAIFLIALFASCSTDSFESETNASQSGGTENKTGSDPIDPNPIDPVVVGALADNIYTLKVNPNDGTGTGLLKNGVDVPLENPQNLIQVSNSVYVQGSDVYVVGQLYTPNGYPGIGGAWATIWKNGLIYAQYGTPDNFGQVVSGAHSMMISNGDLFVVGYDTISGKEAVMWKNGVPTYLNLGGQSQSNATVIKISNSKVCILGKIGTTPALWINQVHSTPNINTANDIAISGDNLYIVGYDVVINRTRPVSLKRSFTTGTTSKTLLNSLTVGGEATSIDIDETNAITYISGYETNLSTGSTTPILWKNNIKTQLSPSNGFTSKVVTFNGNVYAFGGINTSTYNGSALWLNGVENPVSFSRSVALN